MVGKELKDKAVEQMKETAIGIFGAQGHFGQSLMARLEQIRPVRARITGTIDKAHNPEIASRSDLLIVSVRPQDVRTLFEEPVQGIKHHLKDDSRILSFAAGIPLRTIAELSGRPSARGMADPWWNFSAFIHTQDFNTRNDAWFFEKLGKKMLYFDAEKEFDMLAPGIVHLYVALLYGKIHSDVHLGEHLKYLGPLFQSTQDELLASTPEGDPGDLLTKMQTKGGLTEAAVQAIRARHEITPEELFAEIMRRQEEIRR